MRIKVKYLVGIDEVGRGPLAGPLTVAAVCCRACHIRQMRRLLRDIKDSKKLSFKKREEWNNKIKNEKLKIKNSQPKAGPPQAEKFKIHQTTASISNQIIDKIGITKATNLAVKRVIRNLEQKINVTPLDCYIMLDGLLVAPKKYLQKTIIKGDEKIPIIAAASIIAKVKRDRKMLKLHKEFPAYRFDFHKGYGTKLHYKMINKFGLTPFHRKSFCGVIHRQRG